ncbi:MAG: hypothetical protein M1142_05785 [Patescibacteria group bacterium]|nr:hypothetical protein [Patescibacteria group bacterium]
MKRFAQQVLLTLLYLTPIGYILNLFALQTGKMTPGVYVSMQRETPILAHIKQNPLFKDRAQWLVDGIFLVSQGLLVLQQKLGNIFTAYGWVALVFGIVNFVSAFFPKFDWNKRLGVLRVSILEILVITLLGLSVVLSSNAITF